MSDTAEPATFIKEPWSNEVVDTEAFKKAFPDYATLTVSHSTLGNDTNHWRYVFANCQGLLSLDATSTSQNDINFLFEKISDKMMMEAYFKSIDIQTTADAGGGE